MKSIFNRKAQGGMSMEMVVGAVVVLISAVSMIVYFSGTFSDASKTLDIADVSTKMAISACEMKIGQAMDNDAKLKAYCDITLNGIKVGKIETSASCAYLENSAAGGISFSTDLIDSSTKAECSGGLSKAYVENKCKVLASVTGDGSTKEYVNGIRCDKWNFSEKSPNSVIETDSKGQALVSDLGGIKKDLGLREKGLREKVQEYFNLHNGKTSMSLSFLEANSVYDQKSQRQNVTIFRKDLTKYCRYIQNIKTYGEEFVSSLSNPDYSEKYKQDFKSIFFQEMSGSIAIYFNENSAVTLSEQIKRVNSYNDPLSCACSVSDKEIIECFNKYYASFSRTANFILKD